MLGIHKSYNGADAVTYFRESLTVEGNYYLNESIKSFWQGKTNELLDLDGEDTIDNEGIIANK